MNRKVIPISQGEGVTKYLVRIEGEACQIDTMDAFVKLIKMMETVQLQPSLIAVPGHSCPSRVTFTHTGSAWHLESESIIVGGENGQADPASAKKGRIKQDS